jgi:hypothetical protein
VLAKQVLANKKGATEIVNPLMTDKKGTKTTHGMGALNVPFVTSPIYLAGSIPNFRRADLEDSKESTRDASIFLSSHPKAK